MPRRRSKSCLVVDGRGIAREAVDACLRRHDFSLRRAADGDEALAMCRQAMPDLIVLASAARPMDGLGFLERLRRRRQGREPVVLFCAAEADPEMLGAAIAGGASECLTEPFDADLLEFKLQQSGLL